MAKVSVQAEGGYAWPRLPRATLWELLGGDGPRRRARRARRGREQRDWQATTHAAALLEQTPWVSGGTLIVDQTSEQLRYEVFRGVLSFRGAIPLGDVVRWEPADWEAWIERIGGRPRE